MRTASGWVGRSHVEHARGTRARPLDDVELRTKFLAASEVGGFGRAERLIDAVDQLENVNARELARLLSTDANQERDEGLEHE